MKKIVLSILLCSFIVPMMAQERRDTGGRGFVVDDKKERSGDWWNQIGAGVAFYNNHDDIDGTLFIHYIRMKNSGIFCFGPGLGLNIEPESDTPIGMIAFFHGGLELNEVNNILGFKKIPLTIGASLGLQYSIDNEIYPYIDYNAGFLIKFSNHSAISICYFGQMWNMCTEYYNEASHSYNHQLELLHGVRIAYKF